MIINVWTPGFNVASELQAEKPRTSNGFHVLVHNLVYSTRKYNLLLSKPECKAGQVFDC